MVLQLCGGRISLSCSECCCNFLMCYEKVTSWSLAGARRLNRSPMLLITCRWTNQLSGSTAVRPPLCRTITHAGNMLYDSHTYFIFRLTGSRAEWEKNQQPHCHPLELCAELFYSVQSCLLGYVYTRTAFLELSGTWKTSDQSCMVGMYIQCAYICMQLSCL